MLGKLSLLESNYCQCDNCRQYSKSQTCISRGVFCFNFGLISRLYCGLVSRFLGSGLFNCGSGNLGSVYSIESNERIFGGSANDEVVACAGGKVDTEFVSSHVILSHLEAEVYIRNAVSDFNSILSANLAFACSKVRVPQSIAVACIPVYVILETNLEACAAFSGKNHFAFECDYKMSSAVSDSGGKLKLLVIVKPAVEPPVGFGLGAVCCENYFALGRLSCECGYCHSKNKHHCYNCG